MATHCCALLVSVALFEWHTPENARRKATLLAQFWDWYPPPRHLPETSFCNWDR